ncbi:hypothetical protein N7E81_00885 [Reichenbachiella carrageenanivorans]|uniref:Tetratricopeptide repeat-containing protein n=1 Tax=Reichenbachiella carrageenanivorans TaxID=2979869 RepID=A0ABY6D219_9BACT|nr:hypothetical protein [Reichenbachiella carrageenanivorans]UXX79665.1 hypothetical protein N7E81_00885 [Reichenbachiella carrageenanivorans]
MNKFAFWNEWEAPFQLTFKLIAGLLLATIASFLIIHWGGLSPFYYWKITGYLENLNFPIFSNHSAFIESTVSIDLPLIFQKVFGGSKSLPLGYTYAYLIVLYVSLVGCLSIATYLKKFWYYLAMGLWILLIMLSGIGKIGIFGLYDESPIILITLLFLPASYYFNSINEEVGLGWRFLIFLGLLAVTFGLIYLGSSYHEPLLFLARFSYLPAALICAIFILIIGHEIIYGILSLTTPYVKSSTNNTTHFILLSLVYLLNLMAVYLKHIGYLDWNIYYLNSFAAFTVSAILGIWGIKSREGRYGKTLPFYPYTGLLYLALAVITFATLAYQALHANDPFIESMQFLILYSHIGFGLMFFLYIIFNFINQLKQNLPVHQFAYVEDNFPYISARLAGMIVVAALFFRANYSSFYLSVAGYYNGLADLNLALGKTDAANYYYKESTAQSQLNHHANFQLAQAEKRPAHQLAYLKNATKKQPTPYVYASLGKAYENSSQFFDAIFTYQEGLRKFPKNWALQNNLALLYNKTNVADSAIYYLKNSTPGSWEQTIVNTNLKAVSAMHGLADDSDNKDLERFDLQSNALANRLVAADTSHLAFVTQPQSPVLNLFTYSYLKNLGLYCHQNKLLQYLQIIDRYENIPENSSFRKELDLIKALNLYQAGRVSAAIEIIYQIKEVEEEESGKWNTLLGKWSLEQGAPLQASKYLEAAREVYYPKASADLAQAYYQLGDQSLALFLLSKESLSNDSINPTQAAAWGKLFEAMQQNKASWKSYSFEREKQLLATAKQTTTNKRIYYEQLGIDNPYYEEGVIAAAKYFLEEEKNEELAYRILHQGISINEYSTPLIKAYIDHCLQTGLIDFAEDTLIKLYDILPKTEYEAYEMAFKTRKENAQAHLDHNW